MYRRRPNLLTFRALIKVCNRPPTSSLCSLQKLPFCTAIQTPYCFYTTNEPNTQHNSNLGTIQQNVNWVYGQNPYNQFEYNQNHNFAPGYVEMAPRNDFLEYPGDRNGGLLVGYVDHNHKGWNFGVYDGSSGYYTWQENGYEHQRGYADHFQQNGYEYDYRQDGFVGVNNGNLQQRWEWDNSCINYGNFQHSAVNPGTLQLSYYGGSYGNLQHSWGVGYSDGSNGHPPQNWNQHYTQNGRMHQETSHDYSAGNGGTLPFQEIYHNAENPGIYDGYTGFSNTHSNVGVFHQITSGSYQSGAFFDQQTSNQCEIGYVGSLGESSIKPNEEFEVVVEDQLKGTIEELDKFYQECKLKEAVDVLRLLEEQHILVDLPRYLLLFKACCEEKALEEGKSIHEHLLRSGLHLELKIHNKILEMYCSCGSLDDAFEVFCKMHNRNLTTWDTMISFLAKNGHGEDAIALFTQFKETGLRPDGTMFLGIFSACGAVGDTVEGLLHFESMKRDYSIVPSMEHYISVVDMLGTAGNLDEALEFIEKMPLEPSVEVWGVLMNLCRMHGNLELGDLCAERVEVLDPSRLDEQSRAGYLPLKPSDSAKDKEKRKSGQSFPNGRHRVHEYRAGDKSQPELHDLLRGLKQQLKEAGYIPEVKFALHDIDPEGKEEALMAHSERLAVAQGLMTTPARYPIRIIKNIRICVDCHNAMKIITKLVGRELIIRDAKRFHHFKDGLCSCRDYW